MRYISINYDELSFFKKIPVIRQVVNLHLSSFKGFFSTCLGKGFLYLYYWVVFQDKYSISVLVFTDRKEKLVGYAVGSSKPSKLYSKFRIYLPILMFVSLPAIFSSKKTLTDVFSRVINVMWHKRVNAVVKGQQGYGELIFLASDISFKKSGQFGLQQYLQVARKHGSSGGLYITTENSKKNRYVVNIYLRNKFIVEQEFEQKGGRKMYLMRCDSGMGEAI